MQTRVRFVFKSYSKDYALVYNSPPTLDLLREWIMTEKRSLEAGLHVQSLRAFVRKEAESQPHHQYIKLENAEFLEQYLMESPKAITVEYFCNTRKQSISTSLNRIGEELQLREGELKTMVAELKDEANQFYAIQIISKTSRSCSNDIQLSIDIFLVVSDPLARIDKYETHPIYNDEVNITSHIERLKRASLSDGNLTIRARREWGTKKRLVSILSQKEPTRRKINIVQLLTEVRRINDRLMLSLEGPLGEQMWEPADEILGYHQVDLLVIIGVGANLLQEINYPKPLILITSISIEEKRMITQSRNKLDSQNIYNDALSQVFLQNFYQNLFKRIQIGQSVDLATRQTLKLNEGCVWCCCLHEHAAACGWDEIISKIGHMEAHRLFKHKEYKTNNYYQTTNDIQSFLLGGGETCSNGNICCFGKQGLDKKLLHGQVGKIICWNNKCSEVLYTDFEDSEKRLNKFESAEYDNPSGRKRPLTIYKLLQAIANPDQQVLILRSPTLSLAKRYLSFAKEYLQTRYKQAYFCQQTVSNQSGVKKYLQDVLTTLKSQTRMGTNTMIKITLFIEIAYNMAKPDKYYFKLFNEEPNELLAEAKELGLQIERIKFILLTCNPNFVDKYPLFKVDQPQKSELFHYHFSKYSYDYIKANLHRIIQQIESEDRFHDDEVRSKCEEMLFDNDLQYIFLGFISLFSEDGFYLTKYGRIVLEELFGEEVVGKAINHTLPIEVINLNDCVYIQLHKSYQHYFLHETNEYKPEFQKKQLEYYYILYRTYCELTINSDFDNCQPNIRMMMKREGLFSIDIRQESDAYDEKVARCKQGLLKMDGPLLDYNSYRHLYHLNQTEKIIQNFMKRKKNQYVATSKSIIRQNEPFILTYLFWNILHYSWTILPTMAAHFHEKATHFQAVLLIFLIRVEIATPFAEIARLQLYIMMGKIPPKSEELFKYSKEPKADGAAGGDGQGSSIRGMEWSLLRQVEQSSIVRSHLAVGGLFRCSKEMSRLLILLRVYAVQQFNLSKVEINWGQLLKFQEEVGSCIKIAEKIIGLLQAQREDFKDELQDHAMFRNFTVIQWNREILKFTQRKISYYFQLTKMLKLMQTREVRSSREKEFHKQFKLINLVNEFRSQRDKLPQAERVLKHRVLIAHYLEVLMNESEVREEVIEEIKGYISAEYLPLYNHLCQKIEQNTLFNQKGLIICARARTILSQGRPYIMNRKRNLTMYYLKEAIQKLKLKISYFTLNTNTLNNLKSNQQNKRCEVLFLILTIDCPSATQLNFGQDNGINSEPMDIKKFAEQIKSCRIQILVVCGKNSIAMCEQLTALLQKWEYFPNIIAVQSKRYNICDQPYHEYPSGSEGQRERAWQYLCNQVNQVAFDLLAIGIVANIISRLTHKAHALTAEELDEKITKSLRMVHSVLEEQFECTNQVLNQIMFKAWASHRTIDRVPAGVLEDLTAKFYSSEHNLHDESYYENVGRCQEVNQVLTALVRGQRFIEILGNYNTGKSTLLQEVCWISQTKYLFKFGVFIFRLSDDKDTSLVKFQDFFRNRDFGTSQGFNSNTQPNVLIALDNVDEYFLNNERQILKSLRGKAVTVVYSTSKKEWGQALQSILECKAGLTINLNRISLSEVYGQVMSHIKLDGAGQGHRYSKKCVAEFQHRVESIMQQVKKADDESKLSKALQMLKELCPKKQQDKINIFLQFYKRNFEGLIKLLQNIKQIKLKIF